MRISHEEMESRKRISRIQSAISEAITSSNDGFTYEEVLFALTEAAHRWSARQWKLDYKEPE